MSNDRFLMSERQLMGRKYTVHYLVCQRILEGKSEGPFVSLETELVV